MTFSEPVVNVPAGVSLVDASGAAVPFVLLGVGPGGPVSDVQAATPVTSLTIQPLTGLTYGTRYTLRLSTDITDVDAAPDGRVCTAIQMIMNSSRQGLSSARVSSVVLIALLPPIWFVVMHVASAMPFSEETRVAMEIYGLMGGFASVFSTPVALVLSIVYWRRLPMWTRVVVILFALVGVLATLVLILTYANPFFRG